jgi:hypothetical protein
MGSTIESPPFTTSGKLVTAGIWNADDDVVMPKI